MTNCTNKFAKKATKTNWYEPLKRFFGYSLMFKNMCKSKLPPLSRFCKIGGIVKNTMLAYKYHFLRETYDIVEVGNVN